MVIEEGLNQLPYSDFEVVTPTGKPYKGLKYEKGNCGVSIVRRYLQYIRIPKVSYEIN